MGLVYRCTACGREMVLESFHRGRSVPCPRCKAANEVPQNLDFGAVSVETARDRDRAAMMMALSVAAFMSCCLPASAFLWWWSAGAVHRARDEQREVDPLLLNTRLITMIATGAQCVAWGLLAIKVL